MSSLVLSRRVEGRKREEGNAHSSSGTGNERLEGVVGCSSKDAEREGNETENVSSRRKGRERKWERTTH